MPTLVVHGLGDKMVHVSGGRATAAAIHGAELLLIDGMGHDLRRPSSRPSPTASVVPPTAHADSFSRQPPAGDVVREPSLAKRALRAKRARPAIGPGGHAPWRSPRSGASVVVDPGPKLSRG